MGYKRIVIPLIIRFEIDDEDGSCCMIYWCTFRSSFFCRVHIKNGSFSTLAVVELCARSFLNVILVDSCTHAFVFATIL